QQDVVGHMRARLGRGGAADQRGRIDPALAARALLGRIGCAAGGAKGAVEILHAAAGAAGLIDDRLFALGPVTDSRAHRTCSRNMLTCEDSTPPSPCSSATEASRTWRLAARPVI